MAIPKTSVALLSEIKNSPDSLRWHDFYDRYQPVLADFLRFRFPPVDVEEIVQQTMIAFIKMLPMYRYDPELKGSFHSYLIGIARYKALEFLRREGRRQKMIDAYGEERKSGNSMGVQGTEVKEPCPCPDGGSEKEILQAIADLAIRKFLDDDDVSIRDREVFRRTALNHEAPEAVAEAYGITRNNVDQIKSRAMNKVRELAGEMERSVELNGLESIGIADA